MYEFLKKISDWLIRTGRFGMVAGAVHDYSALHGGA